MINSIELRRVRGLQCLIYLLCISGLQLLQSQEIQPWQKNPSYWSYNGEPVLLVGGSDDDNLFQWPTDQLISQLNQLAKAGGNVIRNTMSDRQDRGFELYPFLRLPDGRYDLNQWNPAYWERFEQMLKETAKRKIVVQIEIWDRFDYTDHRNRNHWQRHPYHPKNNINYTLEESGFAARYPDHPGANKQAFFYTTPKQRNNQVVLSYQEAFVDRLLDHSLNYDHVLYCIDNETKAEPAWGEHWARTIKARARTEGKRIYVTEMWDAWDLTSKEHRQTFDRPELYDFVDVSQNNHNSGQKHWDNFLHVKNYLSSKPRPMNTTKTYGATGNKFGHTDQDAVERFWRHLIAGAASARFHRPDSGLGLSKKAKECLAAVRTIERSLRFWDLKPVMNRIEAIQGSQAYLAESSEQALLCFLPLGTESVTINATGYEGSVGITWIRLEDGPIRMKMQIQASKSLSFKAPHTANWLAIVRPEN